MEDGRGEREGEGKGMERAGHEDTGREQVRDSGARGRRSGAGWKGSRELTEGKVKGKYRDQRVKSQEERARRQE